MFSENPFQVFHKNTVSTQRGPQIGVIINRKSWKPCRPSTKITKEECDLARANRTSIEDLKEEQLAPYWLTLYAQQISQTCYTELKYTTFIFSLLQDFGHTSPPVVLSKTSGVNTKEEKNTEIYRLRKKDVILKQAKPQVQY